VTSHFRLSLFPLMAMKHATRNLVSNSESFSGAFLPTYAYNCCPVTKFPNIDSYIMYLRQWTAEVLLRVCGRTAIASCCFLSCEIYKNLSRSDKICMFHIHGACQCQLFLRVILNYESSRQFRTLLHRISSVLYHLLICVFIYAYGDIMRQD